MISALKFNKKVAAKSSNLSLFFSQNDADLDEDAATVLSTELTLPLTYLLAASSFVKRKLPGAGTRTMILLSKISGSFPQILLSRIIRQNF